MTLKAVKISENNYRWLSSVTGELQQQRGEPVSIDEALGVLRRGRELSELAGTWKMSKGEAETIERGLRKGWKRWQIESA